MMTASPPLAREAAGPIRLGQLTLMAFALCLVLWASFAPVAQGVSAAGRTGGLAEGVALGLPEGGRLAAVFVQEGQMVAAGTALARIDSRAEQAELAQLDLRLNALALRRAVLEATRDDRRTLIADPAVIRLARHDQGMARQLRAAAVELARSQVYRDRQIAVLRGQAAQAGNELAGLDTQLAAAARQSALIAAERVRQQSLRDRGLTEEARVLALDREAARLDGEAGALKAARAAAAGRRQQAGAQVLALTTGAVAAAAHDLAALAQTEAELRSDRRRLRERIATMTLTSPVAGQVLGLRSRTPGQILRPAEPLLSILPTAAANRITAELRPDERMRIAPGQKVDIRLPGPGGHVLIGHIAWISADAIDGVSGAPPQFVAEVTLDPDALPGLPPRGIPVSLFIETGEEPLLAWLVSPLAERLGRSEE